MCYHIVTDFSGKVQRLRSAVLITWEKRKVFVEDNFGCAVTSVILPVDTWRAAGQVCDISTPHERARSLVPMRPLRSLRPCRHRCTALRQPAMR